MKIKIIHTEPPPAEPIPEVVEVEAELLKELTTDNRSFALFYDKEKEAHNVIDLRTGCSLTWSKDGSGPAIRRAKQVLTNKTLLDQFDQSLSEHEFWLREHNIPVPLNG